MEVHYKTLPTLCMLEILHDKSLKKKKKGRGKYKKIITTYAHYFKINLI